jgi:hypothetical protein
MFPIRGLILKQDYQSPYVVYTKSGGNVVGDIEEYDILAAFPAQPNPDSNAISEIFMKNS